MLTIEQETVTDWESLVATIDDYFKHFNGYIYRGQADAEWKLESTLSRALQKNYPKAKNKKQLEKSHLYFFRENIRGRNNLDLENVSEDELWALGQHFGLFTPLLDWTRSPYIALYFSLFGECKSGYRSVWAILQRDIDSNNKNIKNKNKRVEIINPITNHNERLVTQRGLFLRMPIDDDLESWVKKSSIDSKWVTMFKISFPDKIRNDVLVALDNMNINYLSLFPDLIGSSLYANYQFEIEPFSDEQRKSSSENEKAARALLEKIKKIKEGMHTVK